MSEPIEVEATTIDEGISPLARSERWLADARDRVAELAAQYRVPDEITTDRAYKDAKAARASVRKDAAALDAERKAMTRELDDALKRFRSEVRGVLEPLTDLDEAYKAALGAYEEQWAAQRRLELLEAYEEYAPDLMPLVPLDRLIERWGSERGRAWLNRSTNVVAAQDALRAAIDQVAADERALQGTVDPEDLEAAKAELFHTLDLGAAMRAAQLRAEQRERVRALEEERRRREEEYRRIAAEEPEPEPSPLLQHVAETAGQPDAGEVPPFIMCCYGSRADADAFRLWCERRGVKATVRPTGGAVHTIARKR